MTHEVYIDLSTRSTPSIRAKLEVAIANDEVEMASACRDELERRGENLELEPDPEE